MDYYSAVPNHYSQDCLTKKWDDVFAFRAQPVGEFCLKYLRLQPSDLLVDVGCGTGHITEVIWKAGIMKNTILAVDASTKMLKNARKREGLVPLRATALEFFSDASKFQQNKVLIAQCIHHFPQLKETVAAMFQNCPPKFVCTIVTYVPGTQMPFWKSMKARFDESVKRGFPNLVEEAMKDAGFEVHTTIGKIVYAPTKGEWYQSLRHRAFQCLDTLSDAEIENGLQELDQTDFVGVNEEDKIVAIDTVAVIVATKKQ